jgi:hypothetical protein
VSGQTQMGIMRRNDQRWVQIENERRTERVDDAFLLRRKTFHATDPLTTVTENANALNMVRTLESRDKKVPFVGTTPSAGRRTVLGGLFHTECVTSSSGVPG